MYCWGHPPPSQCQQSCLTSVVLTSHGNMTQEQNHDKSLKMQAHGEWVIFIYIHHSHIYPKSFWDCRFGAWWPEDFLVAVATEGKSPSNAYSLVQQASVDTNINTVCAVMFLDLRSPQTDTPRPWASLMCPLLLLSGSCRQVVRHRTLSSCYDTLTHVHTRDVTWKERKLRSTGSPAAARGLIHRTLRLLSVHLLRCLAKQRKVHRWLQNCTISNLILNLLFALTLLLYLTHTLMCLLSHTVNQWLHSWFTSTYSHTCRIDLHLVCGNEEVGVTQMISLKILWSGGTVPGISVSTLVAKSSNNSVKTLRTI